MPDSDFAEGKRGDPWFEDGNIVILLEESHVAFKVHRGMLCRHSEIFKSMFEIPQPSANTEMLAGCPVVRMLDPPVELSNLIKALYDGAIVNKHGVEDFLYIAGILRLSTKYFIANLRAQAVRHLTQTWSNTLRGHDEMIELAIKSPIIHDTTYPYVHPLLVLNLARETNIHIIIPSALYFLSLYPLSDILRADHPKLTIDHPSRPSLHLSPQDLQNYTLMFQHRLTVILDFVRRVCGGRTVSPQCHNKDQTVCLKAFSRLSTRLSRSWMTRTGPLHYMVQAVDSLVDHPDVCLSCRKAFEQDVKAAREDFWRTLPTVIGLPGWDEMEREDLPS